MHCCAHPSRPAPNFARLIAWTKLWLVWLAGRLELWPQAHQALDRLARIVGMMIVIQTAADLPSLKRRRRRPLAVLGQRRKGRRGGYRAALGAHLRRKLMAGSVGERIAALFNVVQGLARHIAAARQRLPRGFSRRNPILARPQPAPLARLVFVGDTGIAPPLIL